jgi:uncharacterized protein
MHFSLKLPTTSSPRPHGLSKAHTITLGAARFVPDLSGALHWPDEKTLIIADLHLEQGASLARRGLHVPPYDTVTTLNQLEALLQSSQAKRLILLGDSFHTDDAHAHVDDDTRQRLSSITARTDTLWITGNHDPSPPQGIGGTSLDELVIGSLIFRHIPGDIPEACQEVSGHLHPGASVHHRGHRIHSKCFASDDRRLIMPAFGTYTGALSLSSDAYNGLFDESKGQALVIGRSGLHRFQMKRVR